MRQQPLLLGGGLAVWCLPLWTQRQWRQRQRLTLPPDGDFAVRRQMPLQMMNKSWGGDRLWAIAPAQAVVIRLLRPLLPRRRQQQQPTAGSQRARQRGQGFNVQPFRRIKHRVLALLPQQRPHRTARQGLQARRRVFPYPRPVTRQGTRQL
ncbi:hypothetical protein D3C71_1372320 [compost metagenome]